MPKPTLVMQVMVKYSDVTYMVFLEGPPTRIGDMVAFDHRYE